MNEQLWEPPALAEYEKYHYADPISCHVCGPESGRMPCATLELAEYIDQVRPVVNAARAWRAAHIAWQESGGEPHTEESESTLGPEDVLSEAVDALWPRP